MTYDSMPYDLIHSQGDAMEVQKLQKWPISKSVMSAGVHAITRVPDSCDTPKKISKFLLDRLT